MTQNVSYLKTIECLKVFLHDNIKYTLVVLDRVTDT